MFTLSGKLSIFKSGVEQAYFDGTVFKSLLDIDMNAKKVTNMAVGTTTGDAVEYDQLVALVTTREGQANGLATLDGGGRLPASQLTTSAMEYQGTYDASLVTPLLADGSGNTGDLWHVTVAGTQDFGSGNIAFLIGDKIVYNNSNKIYIRKAM